MMARRQSFWPANNRVLPRGGSAACADFTADPSQRFVEAPTLDPG